MKGSEELEVPSSITPPTQGFDSEESGAERKRVSVFREAQRLDTLPLNSSRQTYFHDAGSPTCSDWLVAFRDHRAMQSSLASLRRTESCFDSGREGLREFQRILRKPNHIVAFLLHTERPITSHPGISAYALADLLGSS